MENIKNQLGQLRHLISKCKHGMIEFKRSDTPNHHLSIDTIVEIENLVDAVQEEVYNSENVSK